MKSILIVEDDQDIRENLSWILENEGYSVLATQNGQTALDLLKACSAEEMPGCIILDLMMPIMDGQTFLMILHRDHPNDLAKIPVLVATAVGNLGATLENLPGSPVKIQKPMDLDELFRAIQARCGKPALS